MSNDIQVVDQIYDAAQSEVKAQLANQKVEIEAARFEGEACGVLKKINYDTSHNEMLKYMTLKKIKEHKSYKQGGMTWVQFCESVGENWRTVDRTIEDMSPLISVFSDRLSDLTDVGLNKIRLLGRSLSDNLSEIENGVLKIDDDTSIPITPENADEIIGHFQKMKREKSDVEDSVAAKKRQIEKLNKSIDKYEKQLAKAERSAKEKGFQPGEEEFLNEMEKLRTSFDGFTVKIDPMSEPLPEKHTPRMAAAYASLLKYIQETANGYYETAADMFFNDSHDDFSFEEAE